MSARRVRYGARRANVYDLYLPATPDGRTSPPASGPTIVLLHGGYWKAQYTKRLMAPMSAALAELGWVVANVEYRRVGLGGGGGGWPGTFDDVAAAIDHLAGDPAVDPGRVVTVGHSAGGHLALWAAGRHRLPAGAPGHHPHPADHPEPRPADLPGHPGDPRLPGDPHLTGHPHPGDRPGLPAGDGGVVPGRGAAQRIRLSCDAQGDRNSTESPDGDAGQAPRAPGPRIDIAAAVSLAGVVDLDEAAALGLGGGAVRALLGGGPDRHPDRYRCASPASLLPLGTPQVLLHGTADAVVPLSLSEGYVRRATAVGDDARLVALDGVDHMAVIRPKGPAWIALCQALSRSVPGAPGPTA